MIPYIQLFVLITICVLAYAGSSMKPPRPLNEDVNPLPVSAGNDSQETQRRINVQQYVRKYDLPLSGIDERGAYFFLHHIDPDNQPVYIRTSQQPGSKAGYRHQNLFLASLHKSFRPDTTWTAAPDMLSFRKTNTDLIVLRSTQPISMISIWNTEGKQILRHAGNLNDTVTLNLKSLRPDTYFVSIKTRQGNQFCMFELC